MMTIDGERTVARPRSVVFAALIDPEVLARAVPGCEVVEQLDPATYRLVIALGLGPVRKAGATLLTVVEAAPPARLVAVRGRPGELTGPGRVEATLDLHEGADHTRLAYRVTLDPPAPFSSLPAMVLRPAVRRGVEQFFAQLATEVERRG